MKLVFQHGNRSFFPSNKNVYVRLKTKKEHVLGKKSVRSRLASNDAESKASERRKTDIKRRLKVSNRGTCRSCRLRRRRYSSRITDC